MSVLPLAIGAVGLVTFLAWARRQDEDDDTVGTRACATSIALLRLDRYATERAERLALYFVAWERNPKRGLLEVLRNRELARGVASLRGRPS